MSEAHNRRKFSVRIEILKRLNEASGYLLPEPVLHRSVNLYVEPEVLLSEFRGELVELEQLNLLTMVAGSLGGPRKIRLTDAGRAEVAANA